MKTVALAAVIGLAATAVAAAVAASGSAAVTAFEWSAYERWLHAPEPTGAAPVIVVRDAASESRFGSGAWDRAVLASLVTSLSRAGAAVIGLDAPLGQPSAPGRGGASSDALLSQAIALAENVVLPIALEPADTPAPPAAGDGSTPPLPQHRSWLPLSGTSQNVPRYRPLSGSLPGFAQYAKGVGHTLTSPDPDGVARRVPLFVRVGDRRVPAYGLALAAAFGNIDAARIPADRHGHVLVRAAGSWIPRGFKVVTFADVVSAIDQRQTESLQNLVADRIVLLLVEPVAGTNRMVTQANLLDRILSGAWPRQTPFAWTVLGSLLLSGLAAWLWLAIRWWKAAIATAILALGYVVTVSSSASLTGLLLPLAIPFVALAVSSVSSLLWHQLTSAYRVRRLEGEVLDSSKFVLRLDSSRVPVLLYSIDPECPPCLATLPFIKELSQDNECPVRVIGIGINNWVGLKDLKQSHAIRFPILSQAQGEAWSLFPINASPSTTLIGPLGRVQGWWRGFLADSEKAEIKRLIRTSCQ